MSWRRLRQLKLAHALLALLVPTLLVLALIELWFTAEDVKRAANAAYDRSLLGALKSIDANVSTESGGLAIELPYRMFEFFELTASGPVHFRVATADGLVELGSADLPLPTQPLKLGAPVFYDGEYFGEPVRLVAYLRELDRPTADSPAKQLVIQVAESFQSRDEFRRVFVRRAAASNLLFLLLTVAASAAAVIIVLKPLARLSAQIAQRPAEALQPLPTGDAPADVRPLVQAINDHMARIEALVAQQRAFLDDASHQLRTHLTTLRMQVDYARADPSAPDARAALDALANELQRAARSTHQLLSLGRSDTATLEPASFDVLALLQDVVREFLPAARAQSVDLGVESAPHDARADRELLREALANLVANAIHHVPQGRVTLSSAEDSLGWSVSVEDNGPGLPASVASRVGTRFLRGEGRGGSGLGLAIVQAIAQRHGGVLRLEPGENDTGLRATLWWPRPRESTNEES